MPIQQTAKQVAINIAKQATHESNEILKSAQEQIMPSPEIPETKNQKTPDANTSSYNVKKVDLSFLNEYKGELEQIRRDNLFKELQRKIAEGEIIPLENYIKELGSEQREVLKAQMEAVRIQKETMQNTKKQSPLEVISKKGRQMFNKIKKRNEQHVETRQPPSS